MNDTIVPMGLGDEHFWRNESGVARESTAARGRIGSAPECIQ